MPYWLILRLEPSSSCFFTAPITAHMMAKTALHQRLYRLERTQHPELFEKARLRLNPDGELESSVRKP